MTTVYLAGVEPAWREVIEGHPILISFAEPKQTALLDVPGWQGKILLDSGAYSVATGKAIIELEDYMAFLERYAHKLTGYFALDLLPGRDDRGYGPGFRYTVSEEHSFDAWCTMREAGFDPIPVYHYGEHVSYLDRYCIESDVVGLSGGPYRSKPEMFPWLMSIFSRWPDKRFHGLGLTNVKLLSYFPFYSVDSVTWQAYAWYGGKSNRGILRDRSTEFYQKYPPDALTPDRIGKQPYPWKRQLGIDVMEDVVKRRGDFPLKFRPDSNLAAQYRRHRSVLRAGWCDYEFVRFHHAYDPYDRTGVDD